MMDRQYFKGVIWPRPPERVGAPHRYVIVGILVTERPIPSLEGVNEALADGPVFGVAEFVDMVRKGAPSETLGDATHVLTTLDRLHIAVEGPGEEGEW